MKHASYRRPSALERAIEAENRQRWPCRKTENGECLGRRQAGGYQAVYWFCHCAAEDQNERLPDKFQNGYVD